MGPKNTLVKLKDMERTARRELIMEAAEHVFSIRPFDKVSMREIADEAGIATSSIYTYFEDQETLFVEVAIREIGQMIDQVREISSRSIHAGEKLEIIINSFIDYIITHDSYFRMMVLFMTQGNLKGASMNTLNTTMRTAFDLFDGVFTGLDYHGDTRKLSHFFFAAMNGILVTYRKLPGRGEDEVIRHMRELGIIMKDMIVAGGGC